MKFKQFFFKFQMSLESIFDFTFKGITSIFVQMYSLTFSYSKFQVLKIFTNVQIHGVIEKSKPFCVDVCRNYFQRATIFYMKRPKYFGHLKFEKEPQNTHYQKSGRVKCFPPLQPPPAPLATHVNKSPITVESNPAVVAWR